MAGFMGGSAYSMSRDIADGFVQVTDRTFRGMTPGDLGKLSLEIDRYLRELRGSQLPTDEQQVVQSRNRKIQRLSGAMVVLRAFQHKRR